MWPPCGFDSRLRFDSPEMLRTARPWRSACRENIISGESQIAISARVFWGPNMKLTVAEKEVVKIIQETGRRCQSALTHAKRARRLAEKTRPYFGGNLFARLDSVVAHLRSALVCIREES